MHLLRFIPIKLTLFLILGILFAQWGHLPAAWAGGGLFLSFSFLLWFYLKDVRTLPQAFGISACITAFWIGAFAMTLGKPDIRTDHYSHKPFQGIHTWQLCIREVLKPTDFSFGYRAEVLGLDGYPVSGYVLLNQSRDSVNQHYQVDDRLVLPGQIEALTPTLNPHGFDYRKYMADQGISHRLSFNVGQASSLPRIQTFFGYLSRTRDKLSDRLGNQGFGPSELGVIQALLLGQRNDIPETVYDDYKDAGAVHLLAISGLHIGVLLYLLGFLLNPIALLPKGKTAKLVLLVSGLWIFALLAGFSPSVVRAVAMFSFVAYALFLERPANTFNILALSMFFILLVLDPRFLFQVGFQMSYSAVLAIVWVYPLLQRAWYPRNLVLRKVWQLFSVGVAAQLGVLPISLFYFHRFPGLFFLSNLLIVPFLGLILGLGLVVIVLSAMDHLPRILAEGYDLLIRSMNHTISWVADREAFLFEDIPFSLFQMVSLQAVVITLVLALSKRTFVNMALFLCAIVVFQLSVLEKAISAQSKKGILVLQQARNTILLIREGPTMEVATRDSLRSVNVVKDYKIGAGLRGSFHKPLENAYTNVTEHWYVVDSSAIPPPNSAGWDVMLLTQSPKLNLDRWLKKYEPTTVIADGSNFPSLVERWKKSCEKAGVRFWDTRRMGAYPGDGSPIR